MKTNAVGIVVVAILLVVTGIGFGIAQAGGTHTDRPVLSFEDQEAFEQGISSSPDAENRPVLGFEDQELSKVAKSPGEGLQIESPIEAGGLPSESNADSAIIETEGNMYREGVDTDGP